MKNNVLATILTSVLLVGYSTSSLAEICYAVKGTVDTKNVTSTIQIGNINLTLNDVHGDEVFSDTAPIIGNITGTDGFGTTLLSHKATFPNGNLFFTSGDKAILAFPYVRATQEDGVTPCSFWIHETIHNIEKGNGLFSNVTSAEVFAEGYISHCPNENANSFELSGELCVE